MRINILRNRIPEQLTLNDIALKGTDEDGNETFVSELNWNVVYDKPTIPDPVSINSDFVNDGTPPKAECGMGVEIEGWLFLPEEIQGNETYRKRTYQRTKIMSGGEFVSRTAYVPMEYTFTCYFDVDQKEPYYYDDVFTAMQNKKCKVISPYISTNPFYAEVKIQKTNPKNSPGIIKVDVKITEIPTAKLRISGDPELKYPETTISPYAIQVKEDFSEEVTSSGSQDTSKYEYQPATSNYTQP